MTKLTENDRANETIKTHQEVPEEERVNGEIMDKYIRNWDRHHGRYNALYPGGGIDQKPRVLDYLLYNAKDRISSLKEVLGFNKDPSISLAEKEIDLEKEVDLEIDDELERD